MILASWQCAAPGGDLAAGLAEVERAAGRAAAAGARMVVLPELILPGYRSWAGGPFDTEGAVAAVAGIARAARIAVVFGLPEVTAEGTYNAAVALGPDGAELARHRKVQLYGPREAALFRAGDRLTVFDWAGHRFGLLICYDVEFPEHVRALAQAGCATILVPTANMEPHGAVNRILVPARAMENAVTIVYANLCGTEGDLTYTGQSVIAGPDGPPLACAGTRATMLLAEVGSLSLEGAALATQRADLRPVPVGKA